MSSKNYELLYYLSKNLQQHTSLKTILTALLESIRNAVDVDFGGIITFEDGNAIQQIVMLHEQHSVEMHYFWEVLMQKGIVGYVYHSRRPVTIRNLATDTRWPSFDNEIAPKKGSALGMPILHEGTVYGVIIMQHSTIDYFQQPQISMMSEISEIAAPVIARLYYGDHQSPDNRYRMLFQHTLVPIILTDINGVITDANYKASEFLGFARGGLRGVPVQDINIARLNQYGILDLLDGEETYFRTTIYDIDGRDIPTLVRARRVNVDGRSSFEWMLQDLTAQMELEHLRRDLSAMVYHDLRGPLGNIHTGITKLNQILKLDDNPIAGKLLHLSLRSAEQLQRLVDSLLDIQRFEDGRAILQNHKTNINQVIHEAAELVEPVISENNQTLTLALDEEISSIIDSDMILRVVINLVENASKYTPDGGTIRVDMKQEHQVATITIRDSGPGIPVHMQDRIFDKFSRVQYHDAPKGLGLGLAFCRLAVEAHGGHIWVESDGKSGSDFKFTLPLIASLPAKEISPIDPASKNEM